MNINQQEQYTSKTLDLHSNHEINEPKTKHRKSRKERDFAKAYGNGRYKNKHTIQDVDEQYYENILKCYDFQNNDTDKFDSKENFVKQKNVQKGEVKQIRQNTKETSVLKNKENLKTMPTSKDLQIPLNSNKPNKQLEHLSRELVQLKRNKAIIKEANDMRYVNEMVGSKHRKSNVVPSEKTTIPMASGQTSNSLKNSYHLKIIKRHKERPVSSICPPSLPSLRRHHSVVNHNNILSVTETSDAVNSGIAADPKTVERKTLADNLITAITPSANPLQEPNAYPSCPLPVTETSTAVNSGIAADPNTVGRNTVADNLITSITPSSFALQETPDVLNETRRGNLIFPFLQPVSFSTPPSRIFDGKNTVADNSITSITPSSNPLQEANAYLSCQFSAKETSNAVNFGLAAEAKIVRKNTVADNSITPITPSSNPLQETNAYPSCPLPVTGALNAVNSGLTLRDYLAVGGNFAAEHATENNFKGNDLTFPFLYPIDKYMKNKVLIPIYKCPPNINDQPPNNKGKYLPNYEVAHRTNEKVKSASLLSEADFGIGPAKNYSNWQSILPLPNAMEKQVAPCFNSNAFSLVPLNRIVPAKLKAKKAGQPHMHLLPTQISVPVGGPELSSDNPPCQVSKLINNFVKSNSLSDLQEILKTPDFLKPPTHLSCSDPEKTQNLMSISQPPSTDSPNLPNNIGLLGSPQDQIPINFSGKPFDKVEIIPRSEEDVDIDIGVLEPNKVSHQSPSTERSKEYDQSLLEQNIEIRQSPVTKPINEIKQLPSKKENKKSDQSLYMEPDMEIHQSHSSGPNKGIRHSLYTESTIEESSKIFSTKTCNSGSLGPENFIKVNRVINKVVKLIRPINKSTNCEGFEATNIKKDSPSTKKDRTLDSIKENSSRSECWRKRIRRNKSVNLMSNFVDSDSSKCTKEPSKRYKFNRKRKADETHDKTKIVEEVEPNSTEGINSNIASFQKLIEFQDVHLTRKSKSCSTKATKEIPVQIYRNEASISVKLRGATIFLNRCDLLGSYEGIIRNIAKNLHISLVDFH